MQSEMEQRPADKFEVVLPPGCIAGVFLIERERLRQINKEGWTPQHDDKHCGGELAMAAVCYAACYPIQANVPTLIYGDEKCGCREASCPHRRMFPDTELCWRDPWPWDEEWDKRGTHNRIKQLVIAGALIAAEIDRLIRIEAGKGGQL